MACAQCGQPNAPNATSCVQCGARLGGPTYGPPRNAAPGSQKKGWSTGAVIAIVLGAILLVGGGFLGIVAAIAIPSLLRARAAANESATIGILRTIGSAEASYYSAYGTYGDLEALRDADMLDPGWREGAERYSYRFTCVRADEEGFEFHAEPVPDQATAGDRSYTITEDYIIRFAEGPKAPLGTSGRELGSK